MRSIDPLQLPEILSKVANFVPRHRRLICLRVSKAWYQAFIGLVWENTEVRAKGPSVETLRSHAHLVKELHLNQDQVPSPHTALMFPNVEAFTFQGGSAQEYQELILRHKWISRLSLYYPRYVQGCGLWDALQDGFTYLNELTLSWVGMSSNDVDALWQLCTHLEVLTIKDVWLPCRGRLSAMEFPRMKRLHLRKLSVSLQESLVMTLVSRCPGLLRFEWDLEKQEAPDSNRFFQLLAAKTWPRLHSLILPQHTVTEDTMATIVGAMQKVISLRFQRSESIQSGTVDLLQPHFGHLQTISLKSSRIHAAVVCPMAQGILSSCPALESFDSTRINGITIAQGKPWVCLRLRILELDIVFDPNTIQQIQPRVLDQLSRLTRLRRLSLWSGEHRNEIPSGLVAMDLRLEKGLDKLSALRSLERIGWGHSNQKMGEAECQWILEHWTCLLHIGGLFNEVDARMESMLRIQFAKEGIEGSILTTYS